jgi:Fur family transcriptional regulator, zinc uptake regulator
MRGSGCAHDDTAPSPSDVLARAEQRCRDRHLQFTPLRRRVLETLVSARQPLGAYDLVGRLSEAGRRVAPISVYRVLDFLTELGLVHRIATRNTYLPCEHAHEADAALMFLICGCCGGIDERTSPNLEGALDRTAASVGFKPLSRVVEIEGECARCQERGAAAPRGRRHSPNRHPAAGC